MIEQDRRNPFVGPRPIQQGEALHGRDKELRALYNRLQARRIVVLHSPSGAGKSSLVQAGLIPLLKENGFEVWKPIRVNLDPLTLAGLAPGVGNRYLLSAMLSLEEGLSPAEQRRSPAELAGLEFGAYLQQASQGSARLALPGASPMVLIFDQFEELLTAAPQAIDEKLAFCQALGHALHTQNYWALFVLREDYLAAFAPYRDCIPTHLSHTFRLDLMGRDGAREALVQLAASGVPGRAFPAVDKLVQDLSMVQTQRADGTSHAEQGLYVEPVYLQVVGRQLWDRMPADDLSIDAEDIEAHAQVSTVLGSYYADALRKLAQGDLGTERAVREWVRSRLIVGSIRAQVRREASQSLGLDNALIDALVNSYLVRTETRAGFNWFELSHDRLVQPIEQENAAWEAAHLHSSQVQARLWESGGRSRALLLGADALPDAEAAKQRNQALWTAAEQDFLSESRQLRDDQARQRKRMRWAAILLAVALVVSVVAGLLAYRQSMAARNATLASFQEQGRLAAIEGSAGPALVYLSEVYGALAGQPPADWTARFLLSGLARSMAYPLLGDSPGRLSMMHFSPDGSHVASAGPGRRAQLWDAGSGRLQATLDTSEVAALAVNGDGAVAVASQDGSVKLFAADGRLALLLESNAAAVQALAFSPDGRQLAIGAPDGAVRLRDIGSGRLLKPESRAHQAAVSALVFSKDGNTLASADVLGQVRLADARTGVAAESPCMASPLPVHALAFTPDGKTLGVAGDEWAVHLLALDVAAGPAACRRQTLTGHTGPVRAIAFAPDGLTLATGGDDGSARLWPLTGEAGRGAAPGTPERPMQAELSSRVDGHTGAVLALAFVRDPQTGARALASAGADGTARRWLPERLLAQLDGPQAAVRAIAFSPDGKTVAGASEDGSVWLFPARGTRQGQRLPGATGPLYLVAISPDGQTIAAAGQDGSAQLWRRAGGPPFASLVGHSGRIRALAFAPDGRTLTTAGEDGTARVWPASGGPALAMLDSSSGPLRAVAYAPDSQTVLTGGTDASARLWRITGGPAIAVLAGDAAGVKGGHRDTILALAFARDGQTIGSASKDGSARLWTVDGRLRAALTAHRGPVGGIVFAPDGMTVATAGADGSSGLWRVADGQLLARLAGHGDAVSSVAFSPPDGRLVVTTSFDRTARIWAVDGGRLLGVLEGHWHYLWAAAFAPDGQTLATASEDGTARLWDLRPEGRPAAEVARQIGCRIPWALERGVLHPVWPLDRSGCVDAAPPGAAPGIVTR